MAEHDRKGALALITAGAVALAAGLCMVDRAHAEDVVKRPVVGAPGTAAAERPLTIRRRAAPRPVDVVGGAGFYGDDYLVRQHGWDDPRLYYFGPFRTGGEVFYGDQAGDSVTRGNAGLGQVAGYGPARGGYGGPHFDAVGGFHQGLGPDRKTDDDFASGTLSRPDYGDLEPRYPAVKERAAALSAGATSRGDTITPTMERGDGRRLVAEGRSTRASFEQAKADFAAPMKRQAPVEAGFANGGIDSIGIGDDAF